MNKKIALLTLLVILATATMITITAVAFSETPLIRSNRTDTEKKFFDCTTLPDRVQLLGDPIGGGWPRVNDSA
jgi:hypothetical protein